jgi:hypothetical protein
MIAFLGQKQLEKGHNRLGLAAEALPRWPAGEALAGKPGG